MSPFNIAGWPIVVTGGAGHLGTAICAGLAAAGARVLSASSRLCDARGVTSALCDIADEKAFDNVLGEFLDGHKLAGLVNCAVRAPRGVNLDMSRAAFAGGIDSILTHYFICTRVARRHMTTGSVVNLASMWGIVAPNPAVYLDLKNEPSLVMPPAAAGILQLTKYLAVAMAPDIRVNALVPGWFPKKRGPERPDYIAEIVIRVPLRRIGKAEEIVGSAIYLLSDASSYMTGQQLVLDGGYTLT